MRPIPLRFKFGMTVNARSLFGRRANARVIAHEIQKHAFRCRRKSVGLFLESVNDEFVLEVFPAEGFVHQETDNFVSVMVATNKHRTVIQ